MQSLARSFAAYTLVGNFDSERSPGVGGPLLLTSQPLRNSLGSVRTADAGATRRGPRGTWAPIGFSEQDVENPNAKIFPTSVGAWRPGGEEAEGARQRDLLVARTRDVIHDATALALMLYTRRRALAPERATTQSALAADLLVDEGLACAEPR